MRRVLFTVAAACGLALAASPASACCEIDPIVVDPGYDCVTEPCNDPQPIVICPPVVCHE